MRGERVENHHIPGNGFTQDACAQIHLRHFFGVEIPQLVRSGKQLGLFRREMGRTVAYLQTLRIARAQELLATTELSTLNVALESGFESVEHFYRVFRRLVGTTPRCYRVTRRI